MDARSLIREMPVECGQQKNTGYDSIWGNVMKVITTFLVLTFALSAPLYVVASVTEETPILILLAPALAALITRWIYQRNVRDLGWKLMKTDVHPRWWHWENSRYIALGYALPLAIGTLVYGVTWAVVSGSYSTENSASNILVAFASAATVGLLLNAVLITGEEVGWRGFLLAELTRRTSFLTAAAASGLVWAAWHYPLIFFAPEVFDFGTLPLYFAVPMFTLILIAVSVVLGWLRLTTGSVWPAVIVHGSHNSFTLSFFNDLTSQTGNAPYIAGEVGVGLLVAWGIVALVAWRIYSKPPIVSKQSSLS